MKNKLQLLSAILLLGLVFNTSAFGQTWAGQTSGTSNDLTSVSFVDVNTGWAVGEGGTILATVDGGSNWVTQTSPSSSTNYCYEVQFVNANNGFIAAGTELWITADGGASWSAIAIPNADNIFGVHFFDANSGFVAGNNESIYYTANSGTNWTTQNRNVSGETLSDISFYATTIIGSAVGSNGIVLKTGNGGSSWTAQTSSTSKYINRVQLLSANDIVATALNNFLYTSDGGTNWFVGYPGYDAYDLMFASASIGRVVCESGKIMNTIDGGASWNEETSGVATALYGIDFVSADIGYIVGAGGVILKTENGSTPVELTSFTAKAVAETVVLNWETATEVNNYGFEVERASTNSATDNNWETLSFVEGHGNSNSPKYYEFVDDNPLPDSAEYRLKQIDTDGGFAYYDETVQVAGYSTTDVNDANLPLEYKLAQNHPNPFNPSTQITFSIPSAGLVKLNIYNVLGEVISELVNENLNAGFHQYQFDATNLTSGIYFYSISVNGFTEVKKMNLVK